MRPARPNIAIVLASCAIALALGALHIPGVPGLAGLAGLGGRAEAHAVAAIGDNNRYLKLTLLGDRIRLAYTVFYGEIPGAALRKAIDRNGDGTIDDAETQAFGQRLAPEIARAVELTIDGVRQPVSWSQIVVGLATPSTAAGALSVDLVAWLCLPVPRGKHAVVLHDDYPIDRPGETEVKVEDSPGVAIVRSEIDGAVDEDHDYKLVGPSGALATFGLELTFTAGERSAVTPDATCPGPAVAAFSSSGAGRGGAIAGIAVATVLGLGAAGWLLSYRLRRRQRVQADLRPAGGSSRRRRAGR